MDSYLLPGDPYLPPGETYLLPGDAVFPEGIALDPDGVTFYVSGSRDGTIFRGRLGDPETEVWQPAGGDGRTGALGMAVDDHGRLFVCGWKTGTVFVYATASGELLARLPVPGEPSGLNDVCVHGGYAYVTDSLQPVVWRLSTGPDGVGAPEEWVRLDLAEAFLNGLVPSPDGTALVVADQLGEDLWCIALDVETDDATGKAGPTKVDLGDAKVAADGLAYAEGLLYACDNAEEPDGVRWFLTAIELSDDGRSGKVLHRQPYRAAPPLTRELATPTTLAYAGGRLLVVESQFAAERAGTAKPPFEVAAVPLPERALPDRAAP